MLAIKPLALTPLEFGKFNFAPADATSVGGGSGKRGFFSRLLDRARRKTQEQTFELKIAMLSTKDCESSGWNSLMNDFATRASLRMTHNASILWKRISTREEPDFEQVNDIMLWNLGKTRPAVVFLEPGVWERAGITPKIVKQRVPGAKEIVEMRFPDYAMVEAAMKDADKTIA